MLHINMYLCTYISKYVEYGCHWATCIEHGRHTNTPINNRNCKLFNSDIEDEFHFVFKCSHYRDIRCKYIKKYYWKKASVFKYIQLSSARNFKVLCKLGCYLQHAFERPEIILRSFSGWLVSVFVIYSTPCHEQIFFLCFIVCMLWDVCLQH